MQDLSIAFRASQLAAHQFHNTVTGPSFLEDHEYLGELYAAYESAYDGVIERIIGLGGTVDFPYVNVTSAETANDMTDGPWFKALFRAEEAIRAELVKAQKGASIGTVNFLQGLADESEQRTYKLRQRGKAA